MSLLASLLFTGAAQRAQLAADMTAPSVSSSPSPPPAPPDDDRASPLQLIGSLAFNSSLVTDSSDVTVAIYGSVGVVGVGVILLSLALVNAAGVSLLSHAQPPFAPHLPRATLPAARCARLIYTRDCHMHTATTGAAPSQASP